MAHGKWRLFSRKWYSVKDDKKSPSSGRRDQSVDESLINYASASATKLDLWQRVFDDLELKKQQLIQSILIPKSNKDVDSSDVNTDPGVVDCIKALNGVVESVKIQYEIDQGKSKIKEPIQKIIKAVFSFQDLI
ncbi:unnamed protein product [Penicillium salamii]|uniref:Uncharacterized protein n=1 Tax=Penicillium salamii TaxID=1612424 RepID=A0A9W4K2Q4_9EURO|nr:unnamed protein product [Penicillium salamii]CAG8195072.1 unnamed protein product [Penicillium salamii]CAG8210932.1 unnamed protein product [Penicillium salamii]CAG8213625.1 unnamed protein product [Penicillium salamii]CAG8257950.1 unnamed protein product [Penicillium salamii]